MTHLEAQAALLAEGDRLARQLGQTLHAGLSDQTRLILLGRSLATNLVNAFLPTVDTISRRAGKPLHAALGLDERGRAVIRVADAGGVLLPALPVDDFIGNVLYLRGRLHPAIAQHLQDAVAGDEHHATVCLIRCLRSKPVLDGMQKQMGMWLQG